MIKADDGVLGDTFDSLDVCHCDAANRPDIQIALCLPCSLFVPHCKGLELQGVEFPLHHAEKVIEVLIGRVGIRREEFAGENASDPQLEGSKALLVGLT